MTAISWQAALASSAFLGGTMIQGLLVLNYEKYVFQRWHGTLLFYAIIALSLFVNTVLARLLPKIESVVLFIHVIGFFCILIPLVYLAPHGSARDVFATFNNGGGWGTDGLSFFIGLSTSMFAFIGTWLVKAIDVTSANVFQDVMQLAIWVSRNLGRLMGLKMANPLRRQPRKSRKRQLSFPGAWLLQWP